MQRSSYLQTVCIFILMLRKGSGNELFITLLRKAGFACHPFLGGKQFPDWYPQAEFISAEENSNARGRYTPPP